MKTTKEYKNIRVTSLKINNKYTFPETDGTYGQILMTNGVGSLTWEPVSSLGITTDDVSEATNLYYTDERVDDRVALLIQDGTGISWTYSDGANTLTGNVTLSPFDTGDLTEGSNLYFTNERVDDRVATLIQDGTGINWTYNDPAGLLTGNVSLAPFTTDDLAEGSSNLYFSNEAIDDRVATLIQDGTGINWTYNDPAGLLTGNVSLAPFTTDDLAEGSNLYFTDERVDDRVAALIQDSATIVWTYNDVAGTLTANAVASPISIQKGGSTISTRNTINFINGPGININIADSGINNRADITISTPTLTLNDLVDVDTTGVQEGDIIYYHAGQWVPSSHTASIHHNLIEGLDGGFAGSPGEYYHLTLAQYTIMESLDTIGSPNYLTYNGHELAYLDDLNDYVIGPNLANDSAVAVYDGTTGKLIKNSAIIVTGNDIYVPGDVTIGGTLNYEHAVELQVEDKIIGLAVAGSPATGTDLTADGGGIILYGDTNKTILWDLATASWKMNQNLHVTGDITLTDDIYIATGNRIYWGDGDTYLEEHINDSVRWWVGAQNIFTMTSIDVTVYKELIMSSVDIKMGTSSIIKFGASDQHYIRDVSGLFYWYTTGNSTFESNINTIKATNNFIENTSASGKLSIKNGTGGGLREWTIGENYNEIELYSGSSSSTSKLVFSQTAATTYTWTLPTNSGTIALTSQADGTINHNDDLIALQGGSASERYHLDQAQHNLVSLLGTFGSPEYLTYNGSELAYLSDIINLEDRLILRLNDTNISSNTEIGTNIVPAGYYVDAILIVETSGNSAGKISIGTSANGKQVVNKVKVGASAKVFAPLGSVFYSTTSTQSLYISSKGWGLGVVDIYLTLIKIT